MTEQQPVKPPPIVPKEYAGKWIAWDERQTHIIASGRTYDEAYQAAIATGETNPLLAKAPPADVRFVGGSYL
jgi:hypothetical protein